MRSPNLFSNLAPLPSFPNALPLLPGTSCTADDRRWRRTSRRRSLRRGRSDSTTGSTQRSRRGGTWSMRISRWSCKREAGADVDCFFFFYVADRATLGVIFFWLLLGFGLYSAHAVKRVEKWFGRGKQVGGTVAPRDKPAWEDSRGDLALCSPGCEGSYTTRTTF